MAKNLLEKLNTLVRASINDALSTGLNYLPKLGKNLQAELEALRRQLDVAHQDEAEMQQRLHMLSEEVVHWDERADAALKKNQEAQARYAIEQMQRAKQRMTMLQSEIDQHQRAVLELMQHITQLEAAAKVANQTEDERAASDAEMGKSLSEAIREARSAVGAETKPVRIELDALDAAAASPDAEDIEADLAARRSRLAKPE